jgi:hypothetical protein
LAVHKQGHVEITCCNSADFKILPHAELLKTAELLRGASARVVAGTMTKKRCNELELVSGLNFHPRGLLWDRELMSVVKPIEVFTYDWVHSSLQDGIFNQDLSALLEACVPHGVSRADVRQFLKDEPWLFPKWLRHKSRTMYHVFDLARQSSTDPTKIKASCSELLALYGMLRHFVEERVAHIAGLGPQIASFQAVCRVMDLILVSKRGEADVLHASVELQRALEAHMQLHQQAYGTDYIKPKHHWMMDIPRQLVRDRCVLDAFVIERTHQVVKGIAQHIDNTQWYERSVLCGVTTLAFQPRDDKLAVVDGLMGRTMRLPGCPGALASKQLRIFGAEIAMDDVVSQGEAVGIVFACALEVDELLLLVDVMRPVRQSLSHTSTYAPVGERSVWRANSVSRCVAWMAHPDGTFKVVRM